jgi:ComF family protein
MGSVASLALEALVAALAPPRCAACDARVRLLAVFCPSCASTVTRESEGRITAGVDGALVYGGAIARAIGRMKYESRPDLAGPLGDLVWRAVQPRAAALKDAAVVPVPLHPLRLAERGFNQSALLAGRLARRLGAPFEPRALVRVRETQPQMALDRESRRTNVAGAFRARDAGRVHGRRIVLVDDVTTTGATLEACEQALVVAGAGPIHRIVLAVAPQRVEDAARDQRRFSRPRSIMRPSQ